MENETNLNDRLERRKRIDRLKRGILLAVVAWFLISLVMLIFLFIKVMQLQRQVSILAQNQTEINQFATDIMNRATETVAEPDTEASAEAAAPAVETAILDGDNLAEPGDVHRVYLTFDDGPSGNTEAILDILQEKNVKATFFVIGKEDEEAAEMYKRIVKEGHTLGMHSFSHKYSTIYHSIEDFEDDFYRLRDMLTDTTGTTPEFYRFPGSSSNQVSDTEMGEFISFLEDQGVTYFDWNVSSGDATTQAYTKEQITENVLKDVAKYKNSIVLLHDSDAKSTTVEALGELIDALQAEGYELLPIDRSTYRIQYVTLADVMEAQDTENTEN